MLLEQINVGEGLLKEVRQVLDNLAGLGVWYAIELGKSEHRDNFASEWACY